MFPAKPLICGVAAVGSVSTAAVVAHQHGFFSTSNNQAQSSNNTANTGVQNNTGFTGGAATPQTVNSNTTPEQPKPNQKEVEQWLTDNKKSENWKIQIRKSGEAEGKDFKDELITEDDLNGLKDYLSKSEHENLLKSLFSALSPNALTFEKTGNDWKHILAKEDIEKWVEKTSEGKATLKLANTNTPKQLTEAGDLNKLLEDLFKEKSVFEKLKTGDKKNILFDRVKREEGKEEYDWKHTKTEIESWLGQKDGGDNKFKIKIGDDKDSAKELDSIDEEKLIGLLDHLTSEGSGATVLEHKNSSGTIVTLIFKKDSGNGWFVAHTEGKEDVTEP